MRRNEESMSLIEARERANTAYNTLLNDVSNLNTTRTDILPELREQLKEADPFYIRNFTSSRQFKNMKQSLNAYADLAALGSRVDPDFAEKRQQMMDAANQLLTTAKEYLDFKGGEGRNTNEKKRVRVAAAIREFARQQVQMLNNIENHLEDVEDAEQNLEELLHQNLQQELYTEPDQELNLDNEQNPDMNQNLDNEQHPDMNQNLDQEQNPDKEQNLDKEHDLDKEQNPNMEKNEENADDAYEEYDANIMDDTELEAVYKGHFYTNGKLAIEGAFADMNSCIQHILKVLKNMFHQDENTYEKLGLVNRHDSEEPLSEEAKATAKQLMQYMVTREVLYNEQEQRLSEENAEPSLIEIMSDEMEPDDFMSLVTQTPSFQTALQDMTCAGIYDFAADATSVELKNLAGKVRLEMPQTAKKFLIELQGDAPEEHKMQNEQERENVKNAIKQPNMKQL